MDVRYFIAALANPSSKEATFQELLQIHYGADFARNCRLNFNEERTTVCDIIVAYEVNRQIYQYLRENGTWEDWARHVENLIQTNRFNCWEDWKRTYNAYCKGFSYRLLEGSTWEKYALQIEEMRWEEYYVKYYGWWHEAYGATGLLVTKYREVIAEAGLFVHDLEYDSSKPSLMDLPDDCLALILEKLPLKTVIGLEVVCKRMRVLCLSRWRRVKKIAIQGDGYNSIYSYSLKVMFKMRGVCQPIATRCPNLRELHLPPLLLFELDEIQHLAPIINRIAIVKAMFLDTEVFKWIWERTNVNLEEFHCNRLENGEKVFLDGLQAHRKLKKISNNKCVLRFNMISNLEVLSCANVEYCPKTDGPVANVNLKVLSLHGCKGVYTKYDPFTWHIDMVPNLEALTLHDPAVFNQQFFINLKKMDSLKLLALRCYVGDEFFDMMIRCLPKSIETLICRVSKLFEVLEIFGQLPRIKRFYLDYDERDELNISENNDVTELVNSLKKRLEVDPRPFTLGFRTTCRRRHVTDHDCLRVIKTNTFEIDEICEPFGSCRNSI